MMETEGVASKRTTRSSPGMGANSLTPEQVRGMVRYMRSKGKIVPLGRDGLEKCTYVTTGPGKHAQVDCRRVGYTGAGKILVHHIYWRDKNDYALIDPTLHISHLDAEAEVLSLTMESAAMNESRKYCHLFGWYKRQPGEDRPRCPHWDTPCSGPL